MEAIRVPFLNFCFETQRYFSSLSFLTDGETQKDSKDDQTVSLPITAPRGYQIITKQHNHDGFDKIHTDSILFLGYQNDGGNTLMLQTYPAAGTLSIDTEDADHIQFDLNGMQAIQIHEEKDGMFRTIWIDAERQRVYDVSCNGLSEEAFQQYIFELSGMFMAPTLYAE